MICPNCKFSNPIQQAKYCNNCGRQMPLALPTPVITPPPVSRVWLYWLVAVLIVLIAYATARPPSSAQPASVSTSPSSTPEVKPSNYHGQLSPTVYPTPLPAWSYYSPIDSMTGKTEHTASVRSSNTFNFGFPYEGTQHATLILRRHPRYGSHVLLQIERGQFLAGAFGVNVSVRFDDGKPIRFWASGPADHSTETLFIGGYAKFVSLLKKAKVARLSTEVYQQGSPVFEFDVAGLTDF